MFYPIVAYLVGLSNLYLAGKEKALLYIVTFAIFATVSLISIVLSKSKAFHGILIIFYLLIVGFLIAQHGIYGAQFNDYLLTMFEFAIFVVFSVIELLTPSATSEGVL